MAQLRVRKDTDEGIVEVNTGHGWRGMTPDAAEQMADSYEVAMEEGKMDDAPGLKQFIARLRAYAEDLR